MHSTTETAANVKAAGQRTIAKIRYGSLGAAFALAGLTYHTALPWLASGAQVRDSLPTMLWASLTLLAGTWAHRDG